MTKFYSRTTKGFYDPEFHKTMPEDAYEIGDELHLSLLQDQANGKVIVHNGDNPVAIDRITTAIPNDKIWEMVREKRNQLLKDSDFSQLIDIQESLTDEKKTQWSDYRKSLRDITKSENPADIVFPEKPTL